MKKMEKITNEELEKAYQQVMQGNSDFRTCGPQLYLGTTCKMTKEEKIKKFLEEEIKAWGFHISDGMGDTCSGEDNEAELEAATELYKKYVEEKEGE